MITSLLAVDPVPADNDVVAGWVGLIVLIAMVLALVVLGFSLRKQFRKVDRARDAGVFGPVADDAVESPQPAADE